MRLWALTVNLLLLLGGSLWAGQFQLSTGISQRFDYGLEAMVATESRWAAEGRSLRSLEVMPELIWHYSPHWDFGVGFQKMQNWTADGEEMSQEIFYGSTTFKLPLGKLYSLSNKTLLGKGTISMGHDLTILRNSTRLTYKRWMRVTPYIQKDFYWDLEPTFGVTEDLWSVGASLMLNRATSFDIYGMLNKLNADDGGKETLSIIGVGINLMF